MGSLCPGDGRRTRGREGRVASLCDGIARNLGAELLGALALRGAGLLVLVDGRLASDDPASRRHSSLLGGGGSRSSSALEADVLGGLRDGRDLGGLLHVLCLNRETLYILLASSL